MNNSSARLGAGMEKSSASRKRATLFLSGFLAAAPLVSAPALASQTMTQLVEIMRANGTITQAQYDSLKAAAAQDDADAMERARAEVRREDRLLVNQQRTQGKGQNNVQLPYPQNNQFVPSQNAQLAEKEEAFEQKIKDQMADYSWASKVKLQGDLRLRYEYNDDSARENAAGNNINRNRGRVRYRLGVITKPIDKLEVGAGIASGGDDPRSTNQTFGDDFSSKPIRLDYAYGQYKFSDSFEAIGGKFRFGDYLWMTDDLIWDGDINPEGASVHYNLSEGDSSTFANAGVWVLNEFANNASDPYLYYGQLGQHMNFGKGFASLAGTYYGYENTAQPGTFNPAYSAGTNTTDQFQVADVNGELGTSFGDDGKVGVFGQYVRNVASGVDQDTGYAFGSKLAVGKFAAKYVFGDLDANVVPDVFPDSDRDNGFTDMKGHEVEFGYAINSNIEFNLDYYNTERKSINQDDQLVQADINLKF